MPHLEEVKAVKRHSLRELQKIPGVVAVSVGYKEVQGKLTDEVCVIVRVRKKRPLSHLSAGQAIPQVISRDALEVRTDVVEGEVKALSYTGTWRPAPAGISCGHFRITAGTLGLWVKRSSAPEWFILSNNHVLANSNDAALQDAILQPGPLDGGRDPDSRIAVLSDFARIKFEGDTGNGGNGGCPLAKFSVGLLNAASKLLGRQTRVEIRSIDQPYPNLVDAACAKALFAEFALKQIISDGYPVGVRDASLGLGVKKTGRTTEATSGTVTEVDVTVDVGYGDGKIGLFDDQFAVRAASGEFSAGGDSGSAVLDHDGNLAGLLFAGGGGTTYCNRVSHVLALLGVRLATDAERL